MNKPMLPAGLPRTIGEERLRNFPRILLGLALPLWLGWMVLGEGLWDMGGKPIGGDFVAFHAAGQLVLDGRAADVYDPVVHSAIVDQTLGARYSGIPIFYPPPALLLFAALAVLPFSLSVALWLIATAAAMATYVHRATPPGTRVLAYAFPGVLLTLFNGQTSGLVLATVGLGLAIERDRPALGGAILGLSLLKPHFMAVALCALLFGRRFTTLAAALATVAALCAASVALLGPAAWIAFFDAAPTAVTIVDTGMVQWEKMPTVTVSVLTLGGTATIARGLQAAAALAALAAVASVWARGAPAPQCAAAIGAATLLSTPYAYDYDMAFLLLTLIGLASTMARSETRRPSWEWSALGVAWCMPLAVHPLGSIGVPFAPLVIGVLLWMVWRLDR